MGSFARMKLIFSGLVLMYEEHDDVVNCVIRALRLEHGISDTTFRSTYVFNSIKFVIRKVILIFGVR